MFNVHYRTISQNGRVYPSNIAAIGSHRAQSEEAAARYVLDKFGRVEILKVEYVGAL